MNITKKAPFVIIIASLIACSIHLIREQVNKSAASAPEPAEAAPSDMPGIVSDAQDDMPSIVHEVHDDIAVPVPVAEVATNLVEQGAVSWFQEGDFAPSPNITFCDTNGLPVVTIKPGGVVELAEGHGLDDASMTFWRGLYGRHFLFLQDTIAAGEVCKLKGHWWEESMPYILYAVYPADTTVVRTCRLCGRTERKEPGRWVGEETE